MKPVTRQYSFDVDGVAHGTTKWLKVLYPYSGTELRDEELSGASFAHIFAAKTPAVENIIIQKQIMGPCWLKITNVQQHNSRVTNILVSPLPKALYMFSIDGVDSFRVFGQGQRHIVRRQGRREADWRASTHGPELESPDRDECSAA